MTLSLKSATSGQPSRTLRPEQSRVAAAGEHRIGVVVDHDAVLAPQQDDRHRRLQQDGGRRLQALRPRGDRPETGARPVERADELADMAAILQPVRRAVRSPCCPGPPTHALSIGCGSSRFAIRLLCHKNAVRGNWLDRRCNAGSDDRIWQGSCSFVERPRKDYLSASDRLPSGPDRRTLKVAPSFRPLPQRRHQGGGADGRGKAKARTVPSRPDPASMDRDHTEDTPIERLDPQPGVSLRSARRGTA